ncbi:penicillin acylase family protein [Tenacibaculum maritimum]|uniref:penicillin acylase family protein n=1 Tax=Tenacibaculum maritimum TaxID=107401 RepID=UPI001330EE39|nr:penicillin acylase family protein [Tenacibaculum maritimum]
MRYVIRFLFMLIALLLIIGWGISEWFEPKYKGELLLEGISKQIEVYYDEVGVPHINAFNQKDAYVALGYVHAQDRLWQMELVRRISAGRLSEIFGKELLKVDMFFSGLGIEEASEKTILNLDKDSDAYVLAKAYLKGINQFIEEGRTPLEFYLLGVEKEKYTMKDIYNVFGYMAFSFAAAHKTDPLLTEVKEKLGAKYFRELLGGDYENLTLIKSNSKYKRIKEEYVSMVNMLYEKLPISPFIGSNSWVIGADKTRNGKVIFANDPHIGFSQPSVWYQSHIKTPNYEMYGFNLALTPFPLLGHNRKYAYGLTMLENDDIDFYYEENNPNNNLEYKFVNEFLKYDLVEKRIKIKGEEDTVYQLKVSKHGPVVNEMIDQLNNRKPVAMQWIYTGLENRLLEVGYEISHATSLLEFKEGVGKLHAPGLNIMYGDAEGNIAWFASAKLYQYRDSLYTKTFLNGASGEDEILRYLDFKENPKAINPSWNYVYSANNQFDSVKGELYPGYYLVGSRARRIVILLEGKNDFTKQDVGKMLNDAVSPVVLEIVDEFMKVLKKESFSASEKKAIYMLDSWSGYYGVDEVGPVVYNRLVYEFQKNTFQDEIGAAFSQFENTPFMEKVLPVQVKRGKSIWWDDVTTKDKVESKDEIIVKSFKKAFSFLKNQLGGNVEDWKWKRVAFVEHEHVIGKAGGFLKKLFNVGPFRTNGGDQVINNQIYNIDSTGYYKIHAGPSTRRVVDFSDIDNSWGILPTGQSGNVFSKYYKNQAEVYLKGGFVKMKLNQKEIEQSKNVLLLNPVEIK